MLHNKQIIHSITENHVILHKMSMLPSTLRTKTTCLQRPLLLSPAGGLCRQVGLYSETSHLYFPVTLNGDPELARRPSTPLWCNVEGLQPGLGARCPVHKHSKLSIVTKPGIEPGPPSSESATTTTPTRHPKAPDQSTRVQMVKQLTKLIFGFECFALQWLRLPSLVLCLHSRHILRALRQPGQLQRGSRDANLLRKGPRRPAGPALFHDVVGDRGASVVWAR